jgi:hypothetical protein
MKSRHSARTRARAAGPDEYASLVAQELVARGIGPSSAIDIVQGIEASIRKSHQSGLSPQAVVDKVFKSGSSPKVPRNLSEAAGCELVPVEGFFFSDDLLDVPVMENCDSSIASEDRAGLAAGRHRPKRKGRVAGNFSDDEMLYRIAVAATARVEPKNLSAYTKRIFGREVSAKEFEGVFSGSVALAAQKAKLSAVLMSEPKYGVPATLKLMFNLDTGTANLGKMIRVYYKDPSGAPQAYHSIYEIDGKTDLKSGKGLGALITKNTLLFYKSLGIQSIDTHAEWVGRYVWASFGFQWNLDEADRKADELSHYLEPRVRRGQFSLRGHAGSFQFDLQDRARPWSAFQELLDARAITSQSWKTAALFLENPSGDLEHVGKPFLAGVHVPGDFKKFVPGHEGAEGWTGTLVLSERHPTWNVAKARLGL